MSENTAIKKTPINLGPSGRAIAQDIDMSLLQNLYQHLTMERNSSVQYFSISLWFKERDLNGFSSFFMEESKAEMDHSYNFSDYIIARGQTVDLHELPAPIQEWESIEEVISFAFNMESDLTSSLQQLYSISERLADTRTNVFLDPIVEAQIKSEDEFATVLGKVKFANNEPAALLILDSELNKK